MSAFTRLLQLLVFAGHSAAEGSRIAAVQKRSGKHRSQTLPRNQVVRGNLYGMTLPGAYQRPDVLAQLRTSRGSQAIHRARRNAERAA